VQASQCNDDASYEEKTASLTATQNIPSRPLVSYTDLHLINYKSRFADMNDRL
jgi:hypothetical protein